MGARDRLIRQAELYPALLAVTAWGGLLAGRRVIAFVDNDAARGAFLKGASANRASAGIAHEFWAEAARREAYLWVERVPLQSNPADGPSRGDWSKLAGFEETAVRELRAHRRRR